MNEYIFYTTEGMTLPPNEDKEIDNCQILGFIEAKNSSEAMDLLLENNPWIVEAGYSLSEIRVKQVLTKEQIKDIQAIVDYNWADEEKHYEECCECGECDECEECCECGEYPKDHIFEVLKRLKQIYNT